MKRSRLSTWCAAGSLVLAAVVAQELAPRGAFADERPKTSKAVQVPAQGGEGVAPVPGAPPAAEPSLATHPAAGAALPSVAGAPPPSAASRPEGAPLRLRALSLVEGEAMLEIDGIREVVRPGSRIGAHAVKSVGPDRIVLTLSSQPIGLASDAPQGGLTSGHPDASTADPHTTPVAGPFDASYTPRPAVAVPTGWGEATLVIVTFDASGEGKARAFWTSDPAAPVPAEVKRP